MPITSLEQLDLTQTYTYADYLTWQIQDRLELLRGKVALMSPAPNLEHQRISGRLFLEIGKYLEGKTCEVFSAPFDVRLKRKRNSTADESIYSVVQPDLCVICDQNKLDERGCLGAPDLVIEILSSGNTRKEIRDKFTLYEESGVKEYWIVSPHERIMLVYLLNDEGVFIGLQPLTDHETLTTDLLPGLVIQLKEIFSTS